MALSDAERRELFEILTNMLGQRGTELLMDGLSEADSLHALVIAQGDQQRAALAEFREELRGEMAALRIELVGDRERLRGEMGELRDELRGEMGELRDELRGEMGELRTEMAQLRIDMSDRFRQQTLVLVGAMVTMSGLVLATALVA